MHKLSAMLSKLSVNNTSSHPTASDSAHISPELFEEDAASVQKPAVQPFITNVIVKRSGVFNSQRAGGMSSLQQLQFVQMLKAAITDEASLIFAGFKGFKVVTARKNTTCAAAPNGFCDAAEHTASLIAGAETEWRVLEMSEAREYLTDAVEDLWERVLCRTGELREGLRVGDKFPIQYDRVESGTTLRTQVCEF